MYTSKTLEIDKQSSAVKEPWMVSSYSYLVAKSQQICPLKTTYNKDHKTAKSKSVQRPSIGNQIFQNANTNIQRNTN